MSDKLITALIASVTSLIVVIVTQYFIVWRERKAIKYEEKKKIQLEYLNPLRLFLIENHFRLSEIKNRLMESDKKRLEILLLVSNSHEVPSKDAFWFNSKGCYLISSAYLAGCLFACLNRARESIPFLKLSKSDDTKLLALATKVSLGFLRNLGIYYVSQFSIGHDLFNREENRILTYREFCELVASESEIAWFSRLIDFFIETGRCNNLERIDETLVAIKELSLFLDSAVGGGESLEQRYLTEGITKL